MDAEEFAALGLIAPAQRVDPPLGPRDIASMLGPRVAEQPDAEAIVDPGRRLTYAALDRAIAAAAHLFERLGVEPGDRVAASLPNACDIVVAFMAVQRLGAIWVGINTILSPNEKRHILGHSETKLLLTDSRFAAPFDALRADLPKLDHLLVIDDAARDLGWATVFAATDAPAIAAREIDPFAPAAIMYTSGTTGVPKGVVHSQHNMITVCAAGSSFGMMHPEMKRGVVLPLTITNLMILGPLVAFWNGTSCACGQSVKIDPLVDWIAQEKVGTCATVPTIVHDLLQSGRDLPQGFIMGAGGAPLPMPIRNAFKARYGYPLGGSYGLTEAPTVVTETRGIEPPSGSSGLPLPHLVVTIRAEDGTVLPTGEVGEVCVSGVTEGPWAGVYTPALGYWKDGDKSTVLLRGGILHTSDMGRLDENGWIYLADRSSELILRGGSNVYPAEVERVLHEHAGVAACALVGKPDERLGMRTVAFIQPVRTGEEDQIRADLIVLCQESLARYKQPDEWIFVEQFPRNAMGKIVKPALRAQLAEQQAERQEA
ncbi:MAG: acyl--CoA ligase [Sphingomonadaceae bacterium]|nr:acyl--CoA ligase [Sphingomonadaceae bacterium]